MKTRVLPFDDAAIADAARLIAAGEPVAVATETVYGLAADATDATAVARIYQAKGRPAFNPLIVHVPDLAAAEQIGVFNDFARQLAKRYWPGALTIVVPFEPRSGVAALATAGLGTIALRVPSHPAMQALLRATRKALAAPSANASGTISPTRASHVERSLGGRIPLIVDSGATPRGLESTIVDSETRMILRPGAISREELRLTITDQPDPQQLKWVKAPGQLASHYAPAKPLRLEATAAEADEYLIGFGAIPGTANLSPAGDLTQAAATLFDLLHKADASACSKIAVAPVPDEGLGIAINDRLRRAAVR